MQRKPHDHAQPVPFDKGLVLTRGGGASTPSAFDGDGVSAQCTKQPSEGLWDTKMADGRQFTDYRPRDSIRADFESMPGIPRGASAHEIKDALIREADDIILAERKASAAAVGGVWCVRDDLLPGFDASQTCTATGCTFLEEQGPAKGHGVRRAE
jgi:hypothetical protein